MGRWLGEHARELIVDLGGVAGFAALVYGLLLFWPPAAWMVGGGLALACAILAGLRMRR